MRLDAFLVQEGLSASRSKASQAIREGRVSVAGSVVRRPAKEVSPATLVEVVREGPQQWVGRGAQKLFAALADWNISLEGMTCLDLGQSTGGFTQVCLEAGAARVVGIEVGHGQLHESLRSDARVICLEKTNARHLSTEALGENLPPGGFDFATGDLSFISLSHVLPAVRSLLRPGAMGVFLVKPQFELGPSALGKGGIVRPDALPSLEGHMQEIFSAAGFSCEAFAPSAILGGDGNKEFVALLRPGVSPVPSCRKAAP